MTHWFGHVNAAIVRLDREIHVGDTLHFFGHTTDFRQRIDHIEVNHQSVAMAGPGQEVGLQLRDRAREHDQVIKVS